MICSLPTGFAANLTISEGTNGGILGALNNEDLKDGDTLFLNQGTYNKADLDRNILIDKDVTIQGKGPREKVVIDGQKSSGIFTIGEDVNVIFINLTFINGFSERGGAVFNPFPSSKLTFINCTFINNVAINGGAIYNHGSIIVENSNFINNSAKENGGAIFNSGCHILQQASQAMLTQANQFPRDLDDPINNDNGEFNDPLKKNIRENFLYVVNSVFVGNKAANGGAIYTEATYAWINASNFTENSQAIYIKGSTKVTGCNIYNNLQGILIADLSVDITINYNRIFNNTYTTGFDVDFCPEAESRIRDTDIAREMMDFERNVNLKQVNVLDNTGNTDKGENINLNYNWWGSNTPKVNAVLKYYFVMDVAKITHLNNNVLKFSYTFRLNTGQYADSSLLPFFVTDVFKSLTNDAIDSFDARFDRIVTVEPAENGIYTFVTDNEQRIFEVDQVSKFLDANLDQNNNLSDKKSSDEGSVKNLEANQAANSGNHDKQVASAAMKDTGMPIFALLLVLLSFIGVGLFNKRK